MKNHNVLGSLKILEQQIQFCEVFIRIFLSERIMPNCGQPALLRLHNRVSRIIFQISLSTGSVICFWRDVNHLIVVLCHPLFSFKHKSFIQNMVWKKKLYIDSYSVFIFLLSVLLQVFSFTHIF